MIRPIQVRCIQVAVTAVLLAGCFTADTFAQGKGPPSDGKRFVTVGQLASVKTRGSKLRRFVLLDDQGEVMSTLRASASVDLAEFIGQDVGVTARTLIDGETPVLLAESVTTFGAARQVSRDDIQQHIALASHEEELLASRNAVPASVLSDPYADQAYPASYGQPIHDHVLAGDTIVGQPIVTDSYVHQTSCGVSGCDSCSSGCGQASCSSCAACPCGLPGRFWLRADYLIWWTRGMDTPALVTTGDSSVSRTNAGVLGIPGTQTIFGDEELFSDSRSGARFRLGKWCDQCNWIGFETEYFFLADEDQNFHACDVGSTVFARPFFNVNLGREDAELVQFPGVVNGAVKIEADTSFWGISPRLRVNLACEKFGCDPCDPCCDSCNPCNVGGYRMDLLVGYRYLSLEDDLTIRETLSTVDALSPTFFTLRDTFNTSNDFNGVDIGLLWEGYKGPWSLELIGRVAFGNTSQDVFIDGATTTTQGGVAVSDPGALLALESNSGTFSRDEFSVVSEFGATLGYALSARSRFLVGYTFIYWPNVVRAGEQIDLNVNTDLLPPPQATDDPEVPAFAFNETNFWAQGISLGLEYRW